MMSAATINGPMRQYGTSTNPPGITETDQFQLEPLLIHPVYKCLYEGFYLGNNPLRD